MAVVFTGSMVTTPGHTGFHLILLLIWLALALHSASNSL